MKCVAILLLLFGAGSCTEPTPAPGLPDATGGPDGQSETMVSDGSSDGAGADSEDDAAAITCSTDEFCAGELVAGPCEAARCVDGLCRLLDRPDGFECEDGDPCTEWEQCAGGVCGGGVPSCSDVPDAGEDAPDASPPVEYFAVLIQDATDYGCSNSQKGHGADIDAVELGTDASSLAFAAFAKGNVNVPANCNDAVGSQHTNVNAVLGPPDATLSDGFFALGGNDGPGAVGYVAIEWSGGIATTDGTNITVYESGSAVNGIDERFSVSLATDASCTPELASECAVLLSTDSVGTSTIPIAAF